MKNIVHRSALLVVGLVLLLGPSPAAFAQGADRLEEELRRTDEGLQQAREVVLESRSARARIQLEQAGRVQERAWGAFRDGRPVIAAGLTREAREAGLRAVTLAREDGRLRERAQRELEKGVHALSVAREAFDTPPSDNARRLLEEARAQLERGRTQMQEAHYEPAIRLAVSAQRLVKQALGADAGAGADLVLRQIERTEELIDRVRDAVRESGNAEAARILEQAADLQSGAREAYREGRLRMAYAGTREARALANRAAALVRGAPDESAARDALEETDRLLDRTADLVRESGDDAARRMLDKARDHQSRARDLLGRDDVRTSLAETRVARSLAKRALALIGSGTDL